MLHEKYYSLKEAQEKLLARKNVKTDFSNVIYTMGHGIEAHALALKIFNSSGETEYNENEVRLIKKYSELCQPAFIDAINRVIESDDDNQ